MTSASDTSQSDFDSLHALGVGYAQRRDYVAAEHALRRAVSINSQSADALANLASVLNSLARFDDALAVASDALRVDPRHPVALYHRGLALQRLNRLEDAVRSYDEALIVAPRFAEALVNRGVALHELHHDLDALDSLDRALSIRPDHVEALYNRALTLQQLRRPAEAIAAYDRALALRPAFAEALNNRGVNLHVLRRYEDALTCFDRALALRPDFTEALYNRGAALSALERHDDAARDFERALTQRSDLPYARGALLHSRMHVCDWRAYADESQALLELVRSGVRCAEPQTIVNIAERADDQLVCARTWIADKYPLPPRVPRVPSATVDRIRVAYLSADFYDHASMHLMAGLFERHDAKRFDVLGISFGPDPPSPMRERVRRAFARFVDARTLSDDDVATLIERLDVDIAVDLKGFTDDARTGILARRPAPIQVNYLGYPGTMGAPFIDYIVGDRIVIPDADRSLYSEKVVYLPDCYQVNDRQRPIAQTRPTRAQAGLPETGFVFCAFNKHYKITPVVFDVWMRLLRAVDGSVLWLIDGAPTARSNLRREAEMRGVRGDRVVFAPPMPIAEHLARHRLADLFVDTFPCNAHTTASDALWAGLPLVTRLGATFASRVAASLLHAVGLSELVTHSLDEYEARVLALARDASLLGDTRERLSRQRLTSPLFDTDRFRCHLEAAYVEMCNRHRAGESPTSFSVAPIG